MASDDTAPVPRREVRATSGGLTSDEDTRRAVLDSLIRRTARPENESATRRLAPGALDADWSPAEDLGFDLPGASHVTSKANTEQTVASPYSRRVMAAVENSEVTVRVDLPSGRLEGPDRDTLEEAPLPERPSAPATLQSLTEEVPPEPLPEPLPPPRPWEHLLSSGARTGRTTTLGPPRIVTPIFPDGVAPSPPPRCRVATLRGFAGPLGSPASVTPGPSTTAATELRFVATGSFAVDDSTLPGTELSPRARIWVPVLLGSGAALLALGVGMVVLLASHRAAPERREPSTRVAAHPAAPDPKDGLAVRPEPSPAGPSLEEILTKSAALEERRDHRGAYALYSEALQRAPASPRATLGQARTAVELGLPRALQTLTRSRLPEHRRARALLSIRELMLAGQWAQAEVELRRLPEPERRQALPALWMAQILVARGQRHEAADRYRDLLHGRQLRAGSLLAEASLGYSRLLLAAGLREAALPFAKRALKAATGVPSLEAQARALIVRFK